MCVCARGHTRTVPLPLEPRKDNTNNNITTTATHVNVPLHSDDTAHDGRRAADGFPRALAVHTLQRRSACPRLRRHTQLPLRLLLRALVPRLQKGVRALALGSLKGGQAPQPVQANEPATQSNDDRECVHTEIHTHTHT